MTVALASPSSATSLWYLTRGTGTVALVVLTAILVLGVLARAGGALPACPRFVTPALHRNLSLLAVSLIAVHVGCAVVDPYAPIRLLDAVVPFVSAYRPIWLGLGALTFDVMIAVIVTSLLRVRLGQRAWRAVHWLAYACWPLAVAHGLGSGSDVRSRWLLALMVVAGVAVGAAVLWRAVGLRFDGGRRWWIAVGATLAVPLALAGFAVVGPLAPHWAARAGTPVAQRDASRVDPVLTSAGVTAPPHVAAVATFHGTVAVHRGARYAVVFAGRLHGTATGRIAITLTGRPAARGHLELSAGTVAYTDGGSTYRGAVAMIRGGEIRADLGSPRGPTRVMQAHLEVGKLRSFTGRVSLT